MKKKLFCIILSFALIMTMMPAVSFAGEGNVPITNTPEFTLSEVLAEGLTVQETREKLLLYYKNPEKDYTDELYKDVSYFFADQEGNLLKDDYVFSTDEQINVILVLKAPEGRTFTGVFENGIINSSDYMPLELNIFRIKNSPKWKFFGVNAGSDIDSDGISLKFDSEQYKSLEGQTDKQKEMLNNLKYLKIGCLATVVGQWSLFDQTYDNQNLHDKNGIPLPGPAFNLRSQILFEKYFKTEFLSDKTRKITLLQDLTNNQKSLQANFPLLIISDPGQTYIVDLNGYTINRNLKGKDITDEGHACSFFVQGTTTLIIEDSSKAKSGKIIGGSNQNSGGCIVNRGTVIINDGTITDNDSIPYDGQIIEQCVGGILNDGLEGEGNLYLGGTTKIKGNTFTDKDGNSVQKNILNIGGAKTFIGDGTAMNLKLPDGYKVNEPQNGFTIGVSTNSEGQFTEKVNNPTDAKYFTSDDSKYYVAYNEDGSYLELKQFNGEKPVSGYQSENGTVYIDPQAAKEGTKVTVTVVPNEGYEIDGDPIVCGADGEPLKDQPKLTQDPNNPNVFTFDVPTGVEGIKVKAEFKKKDDDTSDILPNIIKRLIVKAGIASITLIIKSAIKNVNHSPICNHSILRTLIQHNILQRQLNYLNPFASFSTMLKNVFSLVINPIRM